MPPDYLEEDSREVVRYFAHEAAAAAAAPEDATRVALSAVGAWSDLDWHETIAAMDRFRHESHPTPRITVL